MVKHVILWKLKENLANPEQAKQEIKAKLEELNGKIEGLLSLNVVINGLSTSTADLMLDSAFESFDALKYYATHPLHVAVANGVVRPNVEVRLCLDYEE